MEIEVNGMRRIRKHFRTLLVLSMILFTLTGCGNGKYAESDILIVSPKDAAELSARPEWVLVDAQKKTSYMKEHLPGAVNIERAEITVSDPVPNSLASGAQVAEAAGRAGHPRKRGRIPAHTRSALEQLQIDVDRWLKVVTMPARLTGRIA